MQRPLDTTEIRARDSEFRQQVGYLGCRLHAGERAVAVESRIVQFALGMIMRRFKLTPPNSLRWVVSC